VKEGTGCKVGHKIQNIQYKYVLSNLQTVLKRMGHGGKDTTMNYMKYLNSQILLIISKLKD